MDRMPPPPPRRTCTGATSSMSRLSLREQALMSGARGPLGTIPDDQPSTSGLSDTASLPSTSKGLALTPWSQYFDSQQLVQCRGSSFNVYIAGSTGPVVYCLHGGGYTGLTWSLIAQQLKARYRVVAPDLRGHGETRTPEDSDLSAETLAQDAVGVWTAIFAEERPPTVVVGHSMGGAVAVRAAAVKEGINVEGVVVIDVVEGTALASLPHMMGVLQSRPEHFSSCEAAMEWAMRTGMSRNTRAVAVSLPSALQAVPGGDTWRWRTDLAASQPHWRGWYEGLSGLFLGLSAPKVLILAGTDRLDRGLTIGQMQGKFQLVLLPQAGHAIHEDEPERTAEVLLNFLKRFRIGEPKLAFPRPAAGLPRVLPVVAGPATNVYPS